MEYQVGLKKKYFGFYTKIMLLVTVLVLLIYVGVPLLAQYWHWIAVLFSYKDFSSYISSLSNYIVPLITITGFLISLVVQKYQKKESAIKLIISLLEEIDTLASKILAKRVDNSDELFRLRTSLNKKREELTKFIEIAVDSKYLELDKKSNFYTLNQFLDKNRVLRDYDFNMIKQEKFLSDEDEYNGLAVAFHLELLVLAHLQR